MIFLRFLFYLSLLAALAYGGLLLQPQIKQEISRLRELQTEPSKLQASRISLAYELDLNSWTQFSIQPSARQIKVVSNANTFMPELSFNSTQELDKQAYGFEFELISSNGTVLRKGIYNHLTRLSLFLDPEKKDNIISEAFYLDDFDLPLDSRVMQLNLRRMQLSESVSKIRLRLASKKYSLKSVVVRVYELIPSSKRELEYLWQRLAKPVQEKLAKGNVYPPEFLTAEERINSVRFLWRPVGPLGIPDKDYNLRRMYINRDLEGMEIQETMLPTGLIVCKNKNITIPVAEGGQYLRFKFKVLNTDIADINLKWYGSSIYDRHELNFKINKQGYVDKFFKGGLLEFISSKDVLIRPEFEVNSTWKSLDVDTMYLRTYIVSKGQNIVYNLSPDRRYDLAFRLDLRLPQGITASTAEDYEPMQSIPDVDICLLDKQNKIISCQQVRPLPLASVYDRFNSDPLGPDPSEAHKVYLNLPPGVARIRIRASAPVLVAAATRPVDLTRKIRVPQDYFKDPESQKQRQPFWFQVYPHNYNQLYSSNRSALLAVQFRPPEDNPELLLGNYLWQSFRPQGHWHGGQILTRANPSFKVRTDSLSARFYPLRQYNQISLQAARGLLAVRPKLLYFNPASSPGLMNIWIDGRKFYSRRLNLKKGILSLPSLKPGRHKLKVDLPRGCKVFMNHIASTATAEILRLGYKLQNMLVFDVQKYSSGQEIINLEFYAFSSGQNIVSARINGPSTPTSALLTELTLRKREFFIRSGQGLLPLLQGPVDYLREPQRMLIPLGEDLPPGKYSITIKLMNGSGGYIVPYRVLPGRHYKRKISID